MTSYKDRFSSTPRWPTSYRTDVVPALGSSLKPLGHAAFPSEPRSVVRSGLGRLGRAQSEVPPALSSKERSTSTQRELLRGFEPCLEAFQEALKVRRRSKEDNQQPKALPKALLSHGDGRCRGPARQLSVFRIRWAMATPRARRTGHTHISFILISHI